MNLETLKTELREFIALSETITPGEWRIESQYSDDKSAACISAGINREGDGPAHYPISPLAKGALSFSNANFIARSRNISPTMAKMLLVQIEWLERFATPVDSANNQLNKLLKLWEETK